MAYEPTFFNPTESRLDDSQAGEGVGDRRDGSVYVYSPEIVLAVNVALAVNRPLLISGPPGSGKSSLAANVARWKRWRYYEDVVTARTQARDLLWGFDAVRRLSDAQAKGAMHPDAEYVEPGVLWWAIDQVSARTRGRGGVTAPTEQPQRFDDPRAVVLIDEIDKADPDVPNSLLVALGSMQFIVEETGYPVSANRESAPFVVITTNDERELPKAFVRRCASLTLGAPARERLIEIATAQFTAENPDLYGAVADVVIGAAKTSAGVQPPSTAEFIDAVRACLKLKLTPTSKDWEDIRRILLTKRVGRQADGSSPTTTD